MFLKCEWYIRVISFDRYDVIVGVVFETIEGVDVEFVGGII